MAQRMILFLTVFLLASCERLFFEPDKATTNALENFEYLWNEIDKKYSYFDLKKIDWDEVRTRYRARLLSSPTNEETFFKLLGDMMNELRDDHTNLISPFNVQIYNVALRHKPNFRWRTVQEHYLKEPYITASFTHDFLENKQIAYVRYSSFMGGFTDTSLDFVLSRYGGTRGLILDLRENGGGSLNNVIEILSRFVTVKTLVAYNRTRNGRGRNDFGAYEPFYINPSDSRVKYMKPVMVLVDRGSYSATTFFALATKALPLMVLVGDTTGGGGGMPNGGELPNGWIYRFSISQVSDLEKNIYAENGVPADIPAELDWTNLQKDAIIEKAIQEILK